LGQRTFGGVKDNKYKVNNNNSENFRGQDAARVGGLALLSCGPG